MNFALTSALLRGQWLIDPIYAINSLGLVSDILAGNVAVEREQAAAPSLYNNNNGKNTRTIAVVPIKGALMKSDQECGPAGMATIGQTIQSLDADPNVSAIILEVDSPGGTVDGTEALGDIVKACQKPVIAWVNGLAASAALWIASNADEIIASTELDQLGSVGVLMSFQDFQPAYEKMGVKFHTLVSDLSPDKVKMFEDLRKGNYEAYIKERLNPIAEKFQDVIKANFPNAKDEHLTGKVYHARDLMGIMVSSIGNLNHAIARAAELAEAQQSDNSITSKTSSMKNFPLLFALLGITELAAEDGFSAMSEEQLETIENALANLPADKSAELQEQIDKADATIADLNLTVQQLNSEIADLRGSAAEGPARVVTASNGAADANADGNVVKEGMPLSDAIEKIKGEFGI